MKLRIGNLTLILFFTAAVAVAVAFGNWIQKGHASLELVPRYERFGEFMFVWALGAYLVFALARWLSAPLGNKTNGLVVGGLLLVIYQIGASVVGNWWIVR